MENIICDVDAEIVRRFSILYPGQTRLTTSMTRRHRSIADDLAEPHREQVKTMVRSPGFSESLQPIPGAVAALSQMLAHGHDVQLCMTHSADAPHTGCR